MSDQRHPYADHPAAAILADHQPVYVTATTQPAAKIRCCCRAWEGAWCDLPAHQTEALARAGVLADGPPPATLTARVLAERADRRTT